MKHHPAADLFPLLEGEELQALADDIREYGLLHPGVVFAGQLLDGRNRKAACGLAGVEFKTEVLAQCDSPTAYVVGANLRRRHLTPIQRACLADELVPFLAGEAKARQQAGGRKAGRSRPIGSGQSVPKLSGDDGRATTQAAKLSGAGIVGTKAMGALRRNAPDVHAAVKAGVIQKVSEAQAIAKLSEAQRTEVLGRVAEGKAVKAAFREVRAEVNAKAVAKAKRETDRYRVICAPIADAHHHVAAGTVDLVLTDPPYNREAIPLYADLARFAVHALRPGGSLLAMAGQSYLGDVLAALASADALAYHWTLAYLTPGGQSPAVWSRAVNSFWKPVIWLVKGDMKPDGRMGDVIRSDVNDNDKTKHHWGQSESGFARLVERFSQPGDVICDPFCGGGTTGAVALALGRSFIGLDSDSGAVAITTTRLQEVAP